MQFRSTGAGLIRLGNTHCNLYGGRVAPPKPPSTGGAAPGGRCFSWYEAAKPRLTPLRLAPCVVVAGAPNMFAYREAVEVDDLGQK